MKVLNENFVNLYKRWSIGKLRTEDENRIKDIMKELTDGKYTINEDGTVDVDGDVKITDSDLINGKFPIRFGKVIGDFDCVDCKNLTSLEGAPEKVDGYFNCGYCKYLTSLKGGPKEVKGGFHCGFCNNLTSLEGAPEKVGGDFYCSRCDNLTSLEGAPKEVEGCFDCSNCKNLTSLEGAPEEVRGWGGIKCRNCPIPDYEIEELMKKKKRITNF